MKKLVTIVAFLVLSTGFSASAQEDTKTETKKECCKDGKKCKKHGKKCCKKSSESCSKSKDSVK